jgi:hypothetical protein
MRHLDISPTRHTSVTMRTVMRQALQNASLKLARHGMFISQQRLMRECLRYYLRLWRGRLKIADRNKRYNQRLGPFEIVPFFTTEALRSVCQARCHHAGISLSRMVDFAIAHYLCRVVEHWLGRGSSLTEESGDSPRSAEIPRRKHIAGFVISYNSQTIKNDGIALEFIEKSEIRPWPPPPFKLF